MFLNLSFGTLNLRFRKRILRNKQLQNARKHVSHCVLQKTNMDYQGNRRFIPAGRAIGIIGRSILCRRDVARHSCRTFHREPSDIRGIILRRSSPIDYGIVKSLFPFIVCRIGSHLLHHTGKVIITHTTATAASAFIVIKYNAAPKPGIVNRFGHGTLSSLRQLFQTVGPQHGYGKRRLSSSNWKHLHSDYIGQHKVNNRR